MSERSSLSRRDFLSFLRSDKTDSSEEKEAQKLRPTVSRRVIIESIFAGTFVVMFPSIANAQGNPRFDLLQLIDSGNLAVGQDSFPDLAFDQQPYLWPCEDVSKKDKKDGFDVPSPSIVFEAQKRFQSSVESKAGVVSQRLEHLSYIKKLAEDKLIQSRGAVRVEDDGGLYEEHKKLMKVYEVEHPLNTKLNGLWQSIAGEARSLRAAVKKAVISERSAGGKGKGRKRCSIDMPDIYDLGSEIAIGSPVPNAEFNDYSDADIPRQFVLEGYRCPDISQIDFKDSVTNSVPYEDLRFLERAVQAHIRASIEREVDYSQVEIRAKHANGKTNAKLRARLTSIYSNGRRHNSGIRRQWESILSDIRKLKDDSLDANVLEAEKLETVQAKAIDRCQLAGNYTHIINTVGPEVRPYLRGMNDFLRRAEIYLYKKVFNKQSQVIVMTEVKAKLPQNLFDAFSALPSGVDQADAVNAYFETATVTLRRQIDALPSRSVITSFSF